MNEWFTNALYVVIDPSAPTNRLADAVTVANWFDASLSIQSVTPNVTERHRGFGLEPSAVAYATERSLRRWVDEQVGRRTSGPKPIAAIHVGNGRLAVEVVSRITHDDHDLVIVAPGTSADRLATVRRLARVCPCPLLVLRRPFTGGDVVVAVDPDDRMELSVTLLSVARDWAAAAGVRVDAVHAYDPVISSLDTGPFGAVEAASFAERLRAAHRNELDELISRVGAGWIRERRVVGGRPADVIIDAADAIGSDLIVVGAAGRRMSAMLIGNTADRILSRSEVSVLIVKPPGFVPRLDVEVDPADRTRTTVDERA